MFKLYSEWEIRSYLVSIPEICVHLNSFTMLFRDNIRIKRQNMRALNIFSRGK